MAILIVMCGLQSSGKSTKAKELAESFDKDQKVVILSSDKVREDYPGISNDKVFAKLYADMNYWLRFGDTVIIDATNITIKARRQIFQNLKEDCFKMCYIMNTPYEECLERLRKRNNSDYPNKIPEEVLKRYLYSFEIPFYEEGWDNIKLDRVPEQKDSFDYLTDLLKKSNGFNQNNKHHTQDLLTHMTNVSYYLKDRVTDNLPLVVAGQYHDIGKLFTQFYKEGDPNAHYYNHENVGTYRLMCNACLAWNDNYLDSSPLIEENLKILFYINYHMLMNNIKTDKSIKKWQGIFKDKFDDLKLFNEADKYRKETVNI